MTDEPDTKPAEKPAIFGDVKPVSNATLSQAVSNEKIQAAKESASIAPRTYGFEPATPAPTLAIKVNPFIPR